ncbi:MAG: carbohydrate porin [Rubritepida sp.]|nr:carbohydrate porin [Rubritepida sp.]
MRLVLTLLLLLIPGLATAQTGRFGSVGTANIGGPEEALIPSLAARQDELEEQGWIFRGQGTFILQGQAGFASPYRAQGSLTPASQARNTLSTDLIIGRRLWEGAEVIVNPSVTRGFGLSNSTGAAAFPNGEAFRLGTTDPNFFVPRVFFRQTIGLSAESVPTDSDPLRFSEPMPRERITITAGKFAVWDIFDDNRYAHDARTQFLNWALVGGGAFDYAADARGFTEGVAVEWENGFWAVRGGAFRVAREVNGLFLDPSITRGFQALGSVERFWHFGPREGAVRVIYGASRSRQSRWSEIAANGQDSFDRNPNGYRLKHNATISFDQQVTETFGVFGRLSWNDGRTQNWMFTEMDRAVSFGGALNGAGWGRVGDTIGLGTNIGFISSGRRRFLEDGGIGFITGDGRLNYRPEWITEVYYDARVAPGVNMALDYQLLVNPAYNADRGPVSVFSLRLRTAF